MSGDAHVRICESLGVHFPRATRVFVTLNGRRQYLWRAVDEAAPGRSRTAPLGR